MTEEEAELVLRNFEDAINKAKRHLADAHNIKASALEQFSKDGDGREIIEQDLRALRQAQKARVISKDIEIQIKEAIRMTPEEFTKTHQALKNIEQNEVGLLTELTEKAMKKTRVPTSAPVIDTDDPTGGKRRRRAYTLDDNMKQHVRRTRRNSRRRAHAKSENLGRT